MRTRPPPLATVKQTCCLPGVIVSNVIVDQGRVPTEPGVAPKVDGAGKQSRLESESLEAGRLRLPSTYGELSRSMVTRCHQGLRIALTEEPGHLKSRPTAPRGPHNAMSGVDADPRWSRWQQKKQELLYAGSNGEQRNWMSGGACQRTSRCTSSRPTDAARLKPGANMTHRVVRHDDLR